MQQELIEMLEKMVKYFDEIPSDSYYAGETGSILTEAEKLVEKAKNNAPAVPDEIDVRTILLDIVPGDGDGQEVYAKNVDDVVNKLTKIAERLEDAERERDYYKRDLKTMYGHQKGEVWYWQGDGQDHPESWVNSLPVVIRADQLRELIAKPAHEVGLTECLKDVVSHHTSFSTALTIARDMACREGNHDDASYWDHELNVVSRMQGQAIAALRAKENKL